MKISIFAILDFGFHDFSLRLSFILTDLYYCTKAKQNIPYGSVLTAEKSKKYLFKTLRACKIFPRMNLAPLLEYLL